MDRLRCWRSWREAARVQPLEYRDVRPLRKQTNDLPTSPTRHLLVRRLLRSSRGISAAAYDNLSLSCRSVPMLAYCCQTLVCFWRCFITASCENGCDIATGDDWHSMTRFRLCRNHVCMLLRGCKFFSSLFSCRAYSQIVVRFRYFQWCRSVIKYGGRGHSGQAIKLFQITPYVDDFQTLNNPRSWTACRFLEKLVLPSIFDTSFILDDVKLAELSNNSFKWKNVTFLGSQNVLWPLLQDPNPSGSAPCILWFRI